MKILDKKTAQVWVGNETPTCLECGAEANPMIAMDFTLSTFLCSDCIAKAHEILQKELSLLALDVEP